MNIVKLKGIEGEFKILQQNGVFLTLLPMTWQFIGNESFYLPSPDLGFKEWQEMGGSLSNDAPIKYEYGRLKCHQNQVENN